MHRDPSFLVCHEECHEVTRAVVSWMSEGYSNITGLGMNLEATISSLARHQGLFTQGLLCGFRGWVKKLLGYPCVEVGPTSLGGQGRLLLPPMLLPGAL